MEPLQYKINRKSNERMLLPGSIMKFRLYQFSHGYVIIFLHQLRNIVKSWNPLLLYKFTKYGKARYTADCNFEIWNVLSGCFHPTSQSSIMMWYLWSYNRWLLEKMSILMVHPMRNVSIFFNFAKSNGHYAKCCHQYQE